MRTAAEILEGAVGVDRDHLVRPQLADPLELERIVGKATVGLRAVHDLADERIVPLRDLDHLLLDRLEVLGREGARHLEVVVEAVLDRRAEPDPRAREELAHRRRQDVRRAVPEHLEGGRVAVGEHRERGVLLDGPVEVPHRAVDARGQRRLGEARTDRLRHRAAGRAGGKFPDAAIRQGEADLTHGELSWTTGRTTGSAWGA